MAKGKYVGVSGVARKVKKQYIGVGGVARKIKKGYIGVGGVARQYWSSGISVTITGNGDYTYNKTTYNRAYVTVNGTKYRTATTLSLDAGTVVTCGVYGSGTTAYAEYWGRIYYNGNSVAESRYSDTAGTYALTITKPTTINLDVILQTANSNAFYGVITITD